MPLYGLAERRHHPILFRCVSAYSRDRHPSFSGGRPPFWMTLAEMRAWVKERNGAHFRYWRGVIRAIRPPY